MKQYLFISQDIACEYKKTLVETQMTLLCNQAKEVMHTDLQGVQNCEKPCKDQCVLVYIKQSKYPCASKYR